MFQIDAVLCSDSCNVNDRI